MVIKLGIAVRQVFPTPAAAVDAPDARRPGLLFLFPSWLYHQVRPYRGTELRISIAFNFGV